MDHEDQHPGQRSVTRRKSEGSSCDRPTWSWRRALQSPRSASCRRAPNRPVATDGMISGLNVPMPSGSRNYNRRTRGSTLPLRERKRLRVHSYPLALRPEQQVAERTAACDENASHGVANPSGQKRGKACCASLYDRMRTGANFCNAPRRTATNAAFCGKYACSRLRGCRKCCKTGQIRLRAAAINFVRRRASLRKQTGPLQSCSFGRQMSV